MSRPATARLKVNPPLGRMPVLQMMLPGELEIDDTYQRSVEGGDSTTLIRRIAQTWNWDLCQPLVVSRRSGQFFVIDGQHRLCAARLRGDIAQLPCVVVEYASAAEEAAVFRTLNQQRRPLNKLDLFKAAVASGDNQALAIDRALKVAGLSLATHTNYTAWKPGMVSHIGGIERAWERSGAEVACKALDVLGAAFSGQVLRYCGTLYRGIARVCADEQNDGGGFDAVRIARFTAMLGRRDQSEWFAAVNRYFGEHPEMFRAEAAESLMRSEWKRETTGQATARAIPARPARVAVPHRDGFGHGAADERGDDEWAWCDQCDARRTADQVAECKSRWCNLRNAG